MSKFTQSRTGLAAQMKSNPPSILYLYLVAPSGHQTVHDIKWVVARALQDKPEHKEGFHIGVPEQLWHEKSRYESVPRRRQRAMIQSKNTSHPKCPGGMGVRSHCISVQALADLQDQDLVVVIDDDDDDDDDGT